MNSTYRLMKFPTKAAPLQTNNVYSGLNRIKYACIMAVV